MAAATVDMTAPITTSFSADRAWEMSSPFTKKVRIIDFATATTLKGSALAQNDTLDVVKIPAGSYVQDVIVRNLVVGTASTTAQVGDSATPTGYIVSVALDAAAQTFNVASGTLIVGSTITAMPFGKFYTTADAVRLTLNNATAVTMGRIEVTALIMPVGTGLTI